MIEAMVRIICDGTTKHACHHSATFATMQYGNDSALAVTRQRAFDDGWGRRMADGNIKDMCPKCNTEYIADRLGKLAEVEW